MPTYCWCCWFDNQESWCNLAKGTWRKMRVWLRAPANRAMLGELGEPHAMAE